jgi:PAT family beta-lactamase induction signal transducer AmpG
MIPGAVSGKIQMWLGYHNFFIWVLISSLPALILSRFVPIGRQAAGEITADPEAQPTRV